MGRRNTVTIHGLADDSPVANLKNPMGPGRHVAIVGDKDNRMSRRRQFFKQLHHLGPASGIQRPGRLIRQEDATAVHQGAGDGNPLLLSTGKLMRAMMKAVTESELLQQPHRPVPTRGRRHARVDGWDLDIFQSGFRGHEVIALKDKSKGLTTQARLFILGHRGHVAALEAERTAGRTIEAAEQMHERGFAGTRRPHYGDEFAAANGQGDTPQDLDSRTFRSAIALADILHRDQGRIRGYHTNLDEFSRRRSPTTSRSLS